jgi:regulator of sigma E protease
VLENVTLAWAVGDWLITPWLVLKVVIGFSIIVFVHELGHFLAAKWMDVRVDRFAVGFFYRVCGYRRGEGFTFGPRPTYKTDELAAKGYGETDYCLNALPFGGYVKMLGEDDLIINEQTGEVQRSEDPRAFTSKSVGRRLVVVSAGVIFNVLFAILVYSLVYLVSGKDVFAPVIGEVEPGGPAAAAGLLPGDRVLAINGEAVRSYDDMIIRSMLAEGPLRVRVERDGEPREAEFVVHRESSPDASPLGGIWASTTTTLSDVVARNPDRAEFKPGDRITHVNGVPVDSKAQLGDLFKTSRGRPVEVTVARPDPAGAAPHVFTTTVRPTLRSGSPDESADARRDQTHILGFCRRRTVLEIFPGAPAEEARFRVGDVLVQWDTVASPLYRDVTASTDRSDRRPTPVLVERGGQLVTLTVTPRREFSLTKSSPPRVGLAFGEEERTPVVADIIPDTPAAELGMPRGAVIVALNDQPAADWFDVVEGLKAAAGTSVAVRFRTGNEEVTGHMAVPSSIINELGLPPTALIQSIAGEREVALDGGRTARLPSVLAVRKLLEKHVGQTVAVEYVTSLLSPRMERASYAVRAGQTDAWQMWLSYWFETPELGEHFTRRTTRIDAGGNPLNALGLGLVKTRDDLVGVYRIMQRMTKSFLTRQEGRVSVKNVSGPIGIVNAAVQYAKLGYADLLFFMAYISVNLALLNLLPIPVVDGGLILFLLLEKLRGKPLSVKVQVAATLTGLGLIVLSFAFVTLQDILKWVGGNL